jgi:uncharacterized protein (TIGR02145 family)
MLPSIGLSEGTKQVRPTAADYGALRCTGAGATSFASYTASANYRLYIHVSNYNEIILFGLKRSGTTNRTYQLKDPLGVTVLSGLCPNTIADSGYIADYNTAIIGPYFSSGGYHPLKYQVLAGSPLGDYYIQFSGSIDFDLFDFQIVNGAHAIAIPSDAIDGRVYSQAWQFYAQLATGFPNPSPADPFSAKIYVLSNDSIVTSCKFNNMSVGECSIFCNQFGCLNTGNFNTDRQSKNTNTSSTFTGIAQYKVFLNNPDPIVYPDGFYGALVGQPQYPYIDNDPSYPLCSGRKIIFIKVNKSGNVKIVITVPYGSPATDVTITTTVVSGVNQILWDGKDGTGTLVPDGTSVNFDITYLNGLTNLPLWDIEANPQGFEITLVRPLNPLGQTPLSYWDDTQLTVTTGSSPCPTPPTGTNFTGCTPSGILPVTGCHPWETTGSDCHNKMINTWWYSASTSQANLGMVQIVTPPPPTVIGDFDRCGPGVVNLIALVLTDEVVRWYDQPTGGTVLGTTGSGSPFSQNMATTGTFTFYAEAYNPTPPYFCTSDTRTPVIVHVIQVPNAPVATSNVFYNCGNGNVTLSVVPLSNINIEWYDAPSGGSLVGLGNSFTTPFLSSTTNYYAQATDVTYSTHCTSTTRTLITAEIRAVPAVTYSTTAEAICSGSSPSIILGSNPAGASLAWIASNPDGNVNGYAIIGSGILTSEVLSINNGVYQSGVVTYAVTPTLASCQGSTTYIDITVRPYPDLSFTPAASTPICSGGQATVTLSSLVANTTYSWSASGYSPNITPGPAVSGTANPIIQPFSNAGHSVETITFNVIPSAAGCTSPASAYAIAVNPVPSVLLPVPAEQTACSNAPTLPVTLVTDVTGTPVDYAWTTACDPGLINCPAAGSGSAPLNLPSASVVNLTASQQNLIYSITANIGSCIGPASVYVVRINPVPQVVFTPPSANQQIICSGQSTTGVPLGSQVITQTVDFNWTVSCDPFIPVCPGTGSGIALPPVAVSNTDTVPRFATYTIMPSVQGCQGISSNYQVQINPSPTVINSSMSQEVCSGDASQLVHLIANVSQTTFTWTATASSGTISGFIPGPITGDIPPQTLFNTSNTAQGYVTYHIIPSSQNGMPCPGAPADYKIYVNPIPLTPISGNQLVCYNQSGTTYTTPLVTNYAYQWNVTGAVSFTGNNTSTINVDWGPGPSGTIQLTVTDQNFLSVCSAISPLYPITINPAPYPVITALPSAASPCGNTTVTYSLGAPQANHSYQWTISGGSPVTSANASISVTWGNTNPVSVNVVESITYSVSPLVVCSAPATKTVILNLIPDAAGVISGTPSVCQSLTQQYPYSVAAINNADGYTWIYNPSAGVNITNSGTSASLNFATGSQSGNLYVQGNKTGCASGPISPAYPVTVHVPPVVNLAGCFDPVTNMNAKPFMLKGGTPLGAGGVYYIDGVVAAGNIFDPSLLSLGNHTVSFTYTDVHTCFSSDTKSVTVLGANPPCGATMTDNRETPPVTYKTAMIGGKCWMTENLRYGTKVTAPSQAQPQPQTDNCLNEKYCLTTDDAVCSTYGGLYQWDEIIQYGQTQIPYQGLCPPAWHIPTTSEWQALIDASQGSGIAGGILQNGSFKALSMGIYYLNNLWSFTTSDNLNATMFWTSTLSGNKPVARGINIINPSVSMYESSRANAFPVRCVRD